MLPFAKVRVPVPTALLGKVELYVSSCTRIITGRSDAMQDWASLNASPRKVLEWFATAGFAASGEAAALAPFQPCAARLASLDQLKHRVRPALAIPRFWQLDGSNYGFDASPHLSYWLAVNEASFVPLLVPTHQMAHFSRALVA
ncbi:hypothetical protein RJO15_24080 [Herbaspirillum huttiense F1]|jgi:hypothetical protein|uniref:Uncharacterized protein n=2 Tax=Herbaspirillum huttiense TaxID=863372 RepID=A0AAJ2LVU9_9BURK|nr:MULTISPECIES: hypothetical protein [Herbaspirillum]MBP1318242.1 hypothetical protein [Herbaspirillum sp. 1130]MCO4859608.1 hypothetical protein [Herbaspirillum sp. WGmk3]MDR6742715.1 hypothetical protein [Herbaspirillum sp. 1173]MDR9838640.1 hypothetical protein [Herbaspirillum huttiense]MDT0358887.1 hypothetical protein [Herbaspirillum huttiense F1]